MKHKSFGFTLAEVALFLAITGVLFVGIIAGTRSSLRQQRYSDSVQSFMNFWQDVYAAVSNTQSSGDGNSEQAVYGKLVVFGQEYNLSGESIDKGRTYFVYDVIGDADGKLSGTDSVVQMLRNLNANIVMTLKEDGADKVYLLGKMADQSMLPWGAVVQSVAQEDGGSPYEGSILVVRNPRTGVINTLASSKTLVVNGSEGLINNPDWLQEESQGGLGFSVKDVNLCVNSSDIGMNVKRRSEIRIIANARNSSGVEMLSADNSENKCVRVE